MHPAAEIQRSIRGMAFSLAQRIGKRQAEPNHYKLAEREEQWQYDVKGGVGSYPVEKVVDIVFDATYLIDSGNQRDSTLDRPQVRLGFEISQGPKGLVPYAHVVDWKQDDDFNYTGCSVKIGAYCPLVEQIGLPPSADKFQMSLHFSIQGYGYVADEDQPHNNGSDYVTPDLIGTG